MVHGGGHHHHSGGGGGGGGGHHSPVGQERHSSWGSDDDTWSLRNQWSGGWGTHWNNGWWGPHQTNQNVVVVDNRDRGMGSSYQNFRPSQRTSTSASRHDECERCCRKFCLGCCTCWYISAVAQETPNCGPMVHWAFLSFCLFVLLVVMSTMNENWTFNAGETRHIPTRHFLTSHIEIQYQIANGIVVYDIEGACPKLTGPTVPLDETWHFHLAPDDYQFDYYYLTKGSTLTVTFQQHRGATDISLLKGQSQLHAVQGDEDYPSFSSDAILTRYSAAVSCEHHHGCHEYSPPIVISYTVRESDVYIIVYDNASSSPGRANATIHIDLTTYDLENQVPYAGCGSLTCNVKTKRRECLLLQAPSDGPIVTVHVMAKRKWFVIISMAIVPMVIALALRLRYRIRESLHDELPPATNPEATVPTAPSDTVDYESIPIVAAENIVPIAVPVDAVA